MITWVTLERTNVNDESAILVRWLIGDGREVKPYDEIAEVETTKALYTISATRAGYLHHLASEGQDMSFGIAVAAISDAFDEELPQPPVPDSVSAPAPTSNRRWTMKAALAAKRHGIDISKIESIGVIQEADVLAHVLRTGSGIEQTGDTTDVVEDFYGPRKQRMMVLGAGRGAVQVVDAISRQNKYRTVGLLDDDPTNHGKMLMGIPIVGPIDDAVELYNQKRFDTLIISFSNDQVARHRAYLRFREAGIPFGNVIDPLVSIHSNVSMGTGNVILANSRVGACTILGNDNFLSAFVNIEHHNVLGDNCTFGPGVMTSSRAVIGDHVKFGTGVFIEPGVKIGDRCVIASGSILTSDVEDGSIVKSVVATVVRRIG